jgi:glycosyltransferase involved in cell wall biosynthesis
MTADAVGGVWRYAMDLGGVLTSRGWNVTVAVMGPPPRETQAAEARRLNVALACRDCRLEWMDDPWDDVAAAGEWLLELERSVAADVVHLNGYAHGALPWRAPAIVVAHSCVRSWWRAVKGDEAPGEWDRYRDGVSRGLAAARLVVAPTAAMLRALGDEYGACPRARVIPNGARADGIKPTASKERAVLAAGRIWDPAKNVQALCAIAGDLPWPVWIAGDAGGCDAFGAAEHLGWLPAEELAGRYARAAIYALPARYEPFGLSVLEAARAGCALVLGDIPSLRENWDGAAVFVNPDDRPELAATLRALIASPGRRASLADRARVRSQRFGVEEMADAYMDAYDDL